MISPSFSHDRAPVWLQWLEEQAHRIVLLEGWPKRIVAFGAGAIGAVALPPLDTFPVFLISFPILVWLLDGAGGGAGRSRWAALGAAFATGWWFGFGFFVAGLWWLGAAFIIGGEQFIWLLPFGIVGLPAGLALFMGLGAVIARVLWSEGGERIFALAFGLGLSEWLRSWVLTGFPWNGFGQAFANHLVLAQIVSVMGADTLGVLAIVMFASLATLATGRDAIARWALPIFALVLFIVIAAFGWVRLQVAGGRQVDFATLQTVPNVHIRIMQPNVTQAERLAMPNDTQILARYLTLSDRATSPRSGGIGDVTHLIWPEAPFPFLLNRSTRALDEISRFLPEKTTLITGAVRAEAGEGANARPIFFNSLHILTKKDGIIDTYDKTHLVPFGEYLPFDPLLRAVGISQFVSEIGGFTQALTKKTLQADALPPIIPLICFESIFSREIEDRSDGAKLFLNVTNDAWFGATFGPYQHFAQARLRAIEYGHPLIRAANSGISAVVDPYGRVIAALGLGQTDVLDAPLPVGLESTLYRRTEWFSFASVMICIFACAALGRLGRRRRG